MAHPPAVSAARRSRVFAALFVAALTFIVPASGASAQEQPVDESARVLLTSNEQGRTYWSYVLRATNVRAAPNTRARSRGKVREFTYSGTTEIVVVLELRKRWARVRYQGIGRRTGWVPTSALSKPKLTRVWVMIDKSRRRIHAYRGKRRLMSAPIGIGARGSPTPGGQFFIRERLVPANSGGLYGALAFGLSAYSRHRTDWPGGGQVGIHGTNQPGLIPGRPSHGCIRVPNPKIRQLARLMPIGTPVSIIN